MIRSWFAAALGSLFLAGSTTGASLPHNDRQPERERPATSSREMEHRSATSSHQVLAVDVQCVQSAVAARETTLSTSATAHSQTVAGAYTARATALNSAYTGTDAKVIRANVKAAWDAFATTTKNAKQTWQRARENAWTTFRTAVKACKGGESVADSSSASLEQQGN